MKELEAVNEILVALNDRPVTTLDDINPTVTSIQERMKTIRQSLLGTGWWFNTPPIKLYPDSDGRIAAPEHTLSIYHPSKDNAEVMGEYLYNVDADTYIWDKPIEVRLVKDLTFEQLPLYAAHYVMWNVLINMYQTDYGVDGNVQTFTARMNAARLQLDKENLRKRELNTSRIRHADKIIGRKTLKVWL